MKLFQPSQPAVANLACLSAMAFWAVGFPAGEILLDSWGAVILIVIRLLLSIPLLMVFWIYQDGLKSVLQTPWPRALFIGGVGFGVGAILLLYGQKLSDPVTPAIAAAMMPITGAILEVVMDGRKLRLNLIIGIALALAGGVLAAGVQLSDSEFGIGALICLIAVSLFAWATRATTNDLNELSPIGQTTCTLTGGLFFNLIVFLVLWGAGREGIEVGSLAGNNVVYLLIFAISSLAISQFLWIWGAGKLGILLASFHMNAMPFYVMVFVVMFFDGTWNWNQTLGAALVALGVIVAQAFRSKPETNWVEPAPEETTSVIAQPAPAFRPVISPNLQAVNQPTTALPFMWTGT